mgnify:FL=1
MKEKGAAGRTNHLIVEKILSPDSEHPEVRVYLEDTRHCQKDAVGPDGKKRIVISFTATPEPIFNWKD